MGGCLVVGPGAPSADGGWGLIHQFRDCTSGDGSSWGHNLDITEVTDAVELIGVAKQGEMADQVQEFEREVHAIDVEQGRGRGKSGDDDRMISGGNLQTIDRRGSLGDSSNGPGTRPSSAESSSSSLHAEP